MQVEQTTQSRSCDLIITILIEGEQPEIRFQSNLYDRRHVDVLNKLAELINEYYPLISD